MVIIGGSAIHDKDTEIRKILLDYYREEYIYWGIVIMPFHLDLFTYDELINMALYLNRDLVSVKFKGNVEGIRFVSPEYVPTEKYISREGNGEESTLGDGLYMYDIDSIIIKNREQPKNKIPVHIKAVDVEYYRIIAYNDGDKSDEILVAPSQLVEVVKVFNDYQEYKNYEFNS